MKKTFRYLWLVCAALCFTACQQEWEDELYEQTISFAKNGVTDIHVRYKPNGKVSYQLPVVVSGTLNNHKDMEVNVSLDPDTLANVNKERFSTREDLYFLQLAPKFYSIPPTVSIASGQNVALFNIDFTLNGINMTRNHILPLTISEGNGYEVNIRKHFRKALLNVIPFNDYSGTYSATNAVIDDGSGKPMTVATRRAEVVDENTIFFYAGMIQEDLIDRETYKVLCKFVRQSEEGKPDQGIVELSAPDSRIGFSGTGSYMVSRMMDEVEPYLEHIYTLVNLEYTFSELINEETKMPYKVSGSMVLERKRNVLIPDEDQAWLW